MIAPGLRLVAATRAGAALVTRPHSPVVHLYRGPLTPSGRFVPRAGRTVCHAHTRRLRVLQPVPSHGLDLAGRRVCRRCMPLLPAALGVVDRDQLPQRLDWLAAYSHLTVADVTLAGRWATTTEESHQVSRVALMLFGAKPCVAPLRRNPDQAARAAMHDAIDTRRRRLIEQARTPDERAATAAIVEAETTDAKRRYAQERVDAALDRARRRAARGQYLMPHERDLLATA